MKRVLPLAASLLCFAALAHAEVLSVPADFDNIEAAVDAAAPGDVVEVASGVYAESIRIRQFFKRGFRQTRLPQFMNKSKSILSSFNQNVYILFA